MDRIFNQYAYKLKTIIDNSLAKDQFEKAIAAMNAYSDICYRWNQFYTDNNIENAICNISKKILICKREAYFCKPKRVLFYDGFGFDTRGLALIYLKGLMELNYEIIYVTDIRRKDRQPEIIKLLINSKIHYISCNVSQLIHIKELNYTFELYKPELAFFYTRPDDIAGTIVFNSYENLVKRYLINLTDHAFWIGKSAFDFCIEFRNYGGGISVYDRNIDKEKLKILPYYPFINKKTKYQGLPFLMDNCKILFSGGMLYKTFSADHRYYRLLETILLEHKNVVVIYAGDGDSSELCNLSKKFPQRVIHIYERKDLYAFMEHIDVYINTYPLAGGLMTQYAAAAGKVPLTLLANDEGSFSGLLKDQEHLNIQFTNEEPLLAELNKLLYDLDYQLRRGKEMKKACYTEMEFVKGLKDILDEKSKAPEKIKPIKTTIFRKEYKSNFNKTMCTDAIAKAKNRILIYEFPIIFAEECLNKASRKLRKLYKK